MTAGDTDSGDETPGPRLEGSGRKPREDGTGASNVTAGALHQVPMPPFDPGFSDNSYGFRPGRSAHAVVRAAKAHVAPGERFVVDMDLETVFGRVGHDVLMARVAKKVAGERVLRLVRHSLQAGLMQGGIETVRTEGTPQGGPLSPLLSNILLDDLDKELERHRHAFCRFADDCNTDLASKRAGERVLASAVAFLEGRLRLTVNTQKSAVAPVWERIFLGHRLLPGGRLGLAPKSLNRAKDRLRRLTRRNRGIALERMIGEVNSFTTGWVTYFRHAACKTALAELDEWLRRKLRCVHLKHCKRAKPIAGFLMRSGVPEWRAWLLALSGQGWWRLSTSPQAHEAMTV